jgi:general secretion pathway protein M
MVMKLAKREKNLVILAGVAVAVFLLFQFVVFPFLDERKRMRRSIAAKKQNLQEVLRLRSEYEVQKTGFQGIQQMLAKRTRGFTLFSFLEKSASEAELKGNIKYMKPSTSQSTGPYKESTVEMKLEQITLKQLVDYLYRIESPEQLISIKRISIKENKGESGYLDAVLQVLTFQ